MEARDSSSTGAAKFQITNLLRRTGILRDDDFACVPEGCARIVGTITDGLTLMLATIGGISLLVGGIGIMNIMLVSVGDAPRKSDCARPSGHEAVMFSNSSLSNRWCWQVWAVPSVPPWIGTVAVIAAVTPLPAIGATTVLVTVGLSGSIGLFFGVVPARRAALDPIVALRSL